MSVALTPSCCARHLRADSLTTFSAVVQLRLFQREIRVGASPLTYLQSPLLQQLSSNIPRTFHSVLRNIQTYLKHRVSSLLVHRAKTVITTNEELSTTIIHMPKLLLVLYANITRTHLLKCVKHLTEKHHEYFNEQIRNQKILRLLNFQV